MSRAPARGQAAGLAMLERAPIGAAHSAPSARRKSTSNVMISGPMKHGVTASRLTPILLQPHDALVDVGALSMNGDYRERQSRGEQYRGHWLSPRRGPPDVAEMRRRR